MCNSHSNFNNMNLISIMDSVYEQLSILLLFCSVVMHSIYSPNSFSRVKDTCNCLSHRKKCWWHRCYKRWTNKLQDEWCCILGTKDWQKMECVVTPVRKIVLRTSSGKLPSVHKPKEAEASNDCEAVSSKVLWSKSVWFV